jgi:HAMP domain-containing protein
MASSKNNVKTTAKKSAECAGCDKKLYSRVNLIGITLIITLVVAVFGAVVGLMANVNASNNTDTINSLQSEVDSLKSEATKNDIKENGVSYDGKNDKTALELLKDSHKVETKEYSGMGEFVTSIDGVAAEDGKNFWAFYVNGQMAAEGASTYKTKDGEKIEWRLDAIQ